MKRYCEFFRVLLVSIFVVFGLSIASNAQQVIQVAPGLGTLNDAIDANGADDVIFELERGPESYYILSGTIEYEGFHLRIYAEDGDGDRPKIVPQVISGPESFRCFRPKSDLTLKGVYITNVAQDGVMYSKNIVRAQAESIRVVIDDCHFDGDRQSFVRLDAHDQKVYITNSILSWSVLNGRGIDNRSNRVDTLVVENCTFYNLISKVHRDEGGSYIRYLKFNHNTVYNIGDEFFEVGEVLTFIFTNNLVINAGFFGVASTDTDPEFLLEDVDTLKSTDLEGLTQTIEFRNNNFYLDPAIVNAHANLNVEGYTVGQLSLLDSLGNTLVDTSGEIISESIPFTNAPSLDTTLNIIRVTWEEYYGEKDYAPPFDNGGTGAFGEEGFGTCPFDFSYPTTTESYTAADGGQPLGDLNWFGMELSSVEKANKIPKAFKLMDNYPNPFNPVTTIQYELPLTSMVQLVIYNVRGEEIIRLIDGNQTAGVHSVVWNGRDSNGITVSNGIYFYKLMAGNSAETRKMVFLK